MDVTFHFGTFADTPIANPDYKIVGDAVKDAGEAVADMMRAALTGASFPGMTRTVNQPRMAESVSMTNDGLFEFTVHTPEEVEQAKSAYDMKPGLLRGPRHRVNADGRPYNIVPFKHKAEELPSVVAQMAAQLTVSHVIGKYLEIRPDDQWEVMRNMYSWGTNTGKTEDKRHSNMYNFGNGKLLTFRTVSTKSPPNSWIHPGYPENPITDSVWKVMQPAVEEAISRAWEKALMKPWQ